MHFLNYIYTMALGSLISVGMRTRIAAVSQKVQQAAVQRFLPAFGDRCQLGQGVAQAAKPEGIEPCVAKLQEPKLVSIPMPLRCVLDRSFDCAARFRRLTRMLRSAFQNASLDLSAF